MGKLSHLARYFAALDKIGVQFLEKDGRNDVRPAYSQSLLHSIKLEIKKQTLFKVKSLGNLKSVSLVILRFERK